MVHFNVSTKDVSFCLSFFHQKGSNKSFFGQNTSISYMLIHWRIN